MKSSDMWKIELLTVENAKNKIAMDPYLAPITSANRVNKNYLVGIYELCKLKKCIININIDNRNSSYLCKTSS